MPPPWELPAKACTLRQDLSELAGAAGPGTDDEAGACTEDESPAASVSAASASASTEGALTALH